MKEVALNLCGGIVLIILAAGVIDRVFSGIQARRRGEKRNATLRGEDIP